LVSVGWSVLFDRVVETKARCKRVLIVGGWEEMLGEVGLRFCGYPSGANMPGGGGGCEQESKEAQNRDGEENVHTSTRRITSA
jgi:hypothetical protein